MKINNEQIKKLASLQFSINNIKLELKNHHLTTALEQLENDYELLEQEIIKDNEGQEMSTIKTYDDGNITCEMKYNYTKKTTIDYKGFCAKALSPEQVIHLEQDFTKTIVKPTININKLNVKGVI